MKKIILALTMCICMMACSVSAYATTDVGDRLMPTATATLTNLETGEKFDVDVDVSILPQTRAADNNEIVYVLSASPSQVGDDGYDGTSSYYFKIIVYAKFNNSSREGVKVDRATASYTKYASDVFLTKSEVIFWQNGEKINGGYMDVKKTSNLPTDRASYTGTYYPNFDDYLTNANANYCQASFKNTLTRGTTPWSFQINAQLLGGVG